MSAPVPPGDPPPAPELHRRARQAIRLLIGREAVLQLLALACGIVVARILGPGPFGVFGIALFVITLAGLLADLGTRGALIQQAEPATEEQLASCFTLQQLLAAGLVTLLFVTAPALASLYAQAPPELAAVIRVLALDLFLRSWRSQCEIRLERELRYRELAVADVAGSTTFQAVSVVFALTGWGALSLVFAMLAGNVVRVSLLLRAAPWSPRLALRPATLRRLLRAGVPLQAGRAISLAPGWITPTLVAGLIGPEAVGLLAWAATLGRKPLEVLENVVRVSLTHFARLQHDLAEIERVLLRYAVAALLACGLWFAVIATAGRDLVAFVYTDPWVPALPALILYAGSAMVAAVRGLAASALTGVGRFRFTAWVNAAAAGVAIASSVLLVLRVGFVGVPLGQLAGLLVATPWLLRGLRSDVPGRLLQGAAGALLPVAVGLAVGGLCLLLPESLRLHGFLPAALVSLAFGAATWLAGPAWIRDAAREELAAPALRLRRPGTR